MSNNSLAFNIRTCQQLFKVENNSVHPFCTKLSQSASFFWNTSVVFLSAKIFVQNRCRDLLSLFKWRNTYSSDPDYANLPTHISFKQNSANGEFLFLKNCFVSHLTSTRRERTRLLERHLTSVWRRYSNCETIFSHSVLNRLEFKTRLLTSLTAFTTLSSTFFKSAGGFVSAKCSRWIMQRVSNISLGATFLFLELHQSDSSHACSSICAHCDTVSPVYVFPLKYSLRNLKIWWHVLVS